MMHLNAPDKTNSMLSYWKENHNIMIFIQNHLYKEACWYCIRIQEFKCKKRIWKAEKNKIGKIINIIEQIR